MNTLSSEIKIREWSRDDDISRITEVLHCAYAQLAELGFRYHATWQGDDVTFQRLSSGVSYLAIHEELIVGTITLRVPPNVSGCSWYDRGDVASFGQFGVDPAYQKCGIGSRLVEVVEAETKNRGIPNLAIDTAEGAEHLIEIYNRRGYKFVGYADWDITNYRSVIMNKEFKI
jgi:GNAT superfamily N-acetyltransferase